jgi:hypothetical protein
VILALGAVVLALLVLVAIVRSGGGVLLQRVLWSALSSLRRSDRMWSLVDRTGIVVFVGPNGSGKSLAAVGSALTALRGVDWFCQMLGHHHNRPLSSHIDDCEDGCDRDTSRPVTLCETGQALAADVTSGVRLVYSTVPLLGDDGEPHDLYRPLVDFRQLVTIEHADVLFDEVAGVSDASDSAGVPVQVTNWLHQLRKRDVRLRVTTPAYARCSKPIRQVAQVVVDARSFFAESASSGRLWRPRRAMLFRAFDAFTFDEFTASTSSGDRVKPLAAAAFWRPGSEASRRYDTLSAVTALGHVTAGGMCGVCGGTRSRPRCACDHAVDEMPASMLSIEETVSASGSRTRKATVLELSPPANRNEQLQEIAGDVVSVPGEQIATPVAPILRSLRARQPSNR